LSDLGHASLAILRLSFIDDSNAATTVKIAGRPVADP